MTDLIAVTSYGRNAGSARVRVFDWLEKLGLNAEVSDYMSQPSNSPRQLLSHPISMALAEAHLRRLAGRTANRTVLLSRRASPFSDGSLEKKILGRASHGVYDFDDAIMHKSSSIQDSLWPQKRIWIRSVEAASVVIAGNHYLAEEASRYNANTIIIPSCVDVDSYTRKTDYEIGSVPICVWMGSRGTESYLQSVADPLLAMHKSHGLNLLVVSAGSASLGRLDQMVQRVSWSADSYTSVLAQADFGIMPMQDNDWNRGKCAYKLLQYGATGLPMIGSDVGASSKVLKSGGGWAVASHADWNDALESIVGESADERKARGDLGRRVVRSEYSFNAWAEVWRKALNV